MIEKWWTNFSFWKLCLLTLCLCVSVVNTQQVNAQSLSFPATRADQQYVIQTQQQTPLNLRSICFSADGKTLYVGGYREVLVWSLADATLASRITDDKLTGMITAMQLCDDGKTLAVSGTTPGSSTAPIVLIDTTTRKAVAMLQQAGDTVMCMTLNHAGTQLAVGTYDGMLSLWDMKKHDVLKAFPQQASAVSDIAFDDKDAWLANCNRAGQIEVFETTEGFPSKLRTTVSDAALALLFEDGKTTNLAVAVGGSKEQSVRLINAKNTKSARKLGNTPQMPLDLCWAPTSRMAYLAGSDGSIVSWKRMGQIEKTFKGHTDYVTAICLSPDEKLLASVSLDGTAKIWDASQGLLLATLVQIKPRADTWLFITGQGTFNASSPDVVSFFNQPDATQDALRRQWLLPQQVSEHLGMTTK